MLFALTVTVVLKAVTIKKKHHQSNTVRATPVRYRFCTVTTKKKNNEKIYRGIFTIIFVPCTELWNEATFNGNKSTDAWTCQMCKLDPPTPPIPPPAPSSIVHNIYGALSVLCGSFLIDIHESCLMFVALFWAFHVLNSSWLWFRGLNKNVPSLSASVPGLSQIPFINHT